MLRNITFSILISLFLSLTSFADIVTVLEAKEVAVGFYYTRINQFADIALKDIIVDDHFAITENGLTVFYAINIKNGGYVLVAASNNVKPVLAYSLEGRYSQDDQPENFTFWLSGYKNQIYHAITDNFESTAWIDAEWQKYVVENRDVLKAVNGKSVEPLLKAMWGQGVYYNDMCPADEDGPGGHCVTGCVATAMGMLMNYFLWPDTGVGSYSYDWAPYGTISADFGATTYNWSAMQDVLSEANPGVPELIFHMGVSVDMEYSANSSGMTNHKAAWSMRNYFKYHPLTEYVWRDSTNLDWDSLLITHLDKKIPMYYAGWSDTNYISGHAFIVDGYQPGNYYHFNWGWNGSNNGYFYTDTLNPGGSNFNLVQELIVNGVPDTVNYDYPVYCSGYQELTHTGGTIEDGSGPLYNYADDMHCQWLIAPADSVNSIILSFQRFDVGPNDTLTVYDGATEQDPVLGKYSGNMIPDDIASSSDFMLVTFNCDESGNSEGFRLEYTTESPVYCTPFSVMTEPYGELTDGSGPYQYHNSTLCIWSISPPDVAELTLYFDEFNTEEYFDKLKIYDGATNQLLAAYHGSYGSEVPEPVTSPSGKMFIRWEANSQIRGEGWKAYYESSVVGIDEDEAVEFRIYPNPANDQINISIKNNAKTVSISLIDVTGRIVYSAVEDNPEITINTASIPEGVYFVALEDGSKMHLVKKLLIMRNP